MRDLRDPDPAAWPVSPSQCETVTQCPRKWGLKYIAKMSEPQKGSAQLGEKCHKQAEDYLLSGTLPDQTTLEGQIITSGLHHLPMPPLPAEDVERKFTFTSPGGIVYSGRGDFRYRVMDAETVIADHKTTSDFKWAKSEETLRKDPQAIIYAAEALSDNDDPGVQLRWVYYLTTGSARVLAPQA